MRQLAAVWVAYAALNLAWCDVAYGANPQTAAPPGDFDYYVLSLSWSPEFCYSHPSRAECAQHVGFIVHGLWPQFRDRRGPEYCSHAPGPASVRLPPAVMPDPALVRHEWEAHGTCSGLSPEAYFELVSRAFASIRIPRPLMMPEHAIQTGISQIVHAFESSNPGLPGSAIALTCRGVYLESVNICLTKELRPTACSLPHGCREGVVRITPVR